jgi:uncharacterized protein YndB with AHSA1/START domain
MVMRITIDTSQLFLESDFMGFSPGELFDCFVRPELVRQWWGPEVVEIDGRPGGHYHLGWPAMKWALRGTYTSFAPGERLGFTWSWDQSPELPERHVELLFEPIAEGCRLRLSHGRYDASERDQADRQSHLDGWRYFFPKIRELKG